MKSAFQTICHVSLCALCLTTNAVVLPGTIATNTILPPGVHTVSNQTTIAPGVSLTVSDGSTVQFVAVTASLVVNGTLAADGTAFTADHPGENWGRIWCSPGSTCLLSHCVIDSGGGDLLPPPEITNAMLVADGAFVVISNTVAAHPHGDCFAFKGGTIEFVGNTATSTAPGYGFYSAALVAGDPSSDLSWRSGGNSLPGSPRPGIWMEGFYAQDVSFDIAPPDRLHVARLDVSNAVLSIGPGAAVGMSDYTPGSMHFWPGAGFRFRGAPGDAVVVSNFLGLNPWPGLNLHAQSTGLITWTRITRALGHSLSNAALAISNSVIETLQDGFTVSDGSALDAYRTDFSGFVNRGMEFTGQSRSVLRQCSFHGNNVPYINTVSADGSSLVDARYCWWNSPDGPYPYGAYTNERVTSNVLVFPWLLAPPGAQTNEPFIAITSHASEPVVTSDPQILLWGVCTDDTRVARVVFRNLGSGIAGCAPLLTPSNWAAQVWLFPGTNQIGLSAYDDKGNGSVAGIMVICTGGGSYMGAAQPPVFAPIPQRVVARFRPLQFDVIAAAPEPAVLTYWAEGLPQGAMFNPVARRFTWTPLAAGIFTNIRFFATDGMLVGSVGAAIIVSNITSGALPPITILTETLPTAYRYEPYYCALAVENAAGPVTWSFAGPTPPEGLEASRAGIIAGVSTYSGDASATFTVTARDARGAASGATKTLVLDTSRGAPPGSLRVATMELPVTVSGTAVSVALAATNGAQPYAWLDGSGILAGHGLTVSNDGMLAGAAHADVEVPWTALVGDASNVSSFASLVLPVVTPGRQLQLVPMGNLLKLRVAHLTAKSLLKLRLRFVTPAGFTIAGDMVATGRAGLTLVDGKMEKTAIPGRKLLYLRKEGSTVNKVLVTQRANDVQAVFLLKNVGLSHAFEPYGVRNATEEITVTLPVWARIGDFSMLVEDVAVPVKSKLGKTSVGTVKW